MKKKNPITDPFAHAQEQTGKSWTVADARTEWEAFGTFETTGNFGVLDDGYKQHCGPTAITNALLSFENRSPLTAGKRMAAQRVFRRVARLGARKHYYVNASLLGIWGGTFNLATAPYMKQAFGLYRRTGHTVKGPYPALRPLLTRALDRDNLLYVELILHPVYGNHHLLVYGYRLLESKDGHKRLYLLTADGWNNSARYLFEGDLLLSRFYAVSPDKLRSDALKVRARMTKQEDGRVL